MMTPTLSPTAVQRFRQILFLPMRVNGEKLGANWNEIVAKLMTSLGTQWQKQDDWLCRPHLDEAPATSEEDTERQADARFSEFVYFQPYVQRLLYAKPQGKSPALIAYTRQDVKSAAVQLRPPGAVAGDEVITLQVAQLQLLWFKLGAKRGIVMLLLEVALPLGSSLPLDQCQDFLDRFRRIYPPYWAGFRNPQEPGRFPHAVTWHLADGTTQRFVGTRDNYQAMRRQTETERHPPLAPHWLWLLDPAQSGILKQGEYLGQIEDERMPCMNCFAFDNPRGLSRGDFMRLCFADEPGASDTLPYAPDFLDDFEARYCYDRFWDGDGLRKGTAWNTTRQMNCGYAHTVLGDSANDFFINGFDGALCHFRRHYLVMGLLNHFQRVALLDFSDQLSQSLTEHENDGTGDPLKADEAFRVATRETLKQILNFTDRYWFPEISTQIQARELNTLWRGHLNLQPLYDQVMHEAREVTAFLNAEAEQRQAEFAKATNERIGMVGVIMGVAGALATGAFGLLTDEFKFNPARLLQGELDANVWYGLLNGVIGLGLIVALLTVLRHPRIIKPLVNWLFGKPGQNTEKNP